MKLKYLLICYLVCGFFQAFHCAFAEQLASHDIKSSIAVPNSRCGSSFLKQKPLSVYPKDTTAYKALPFETGFQTKYEGEDFDYPANQAQGNFFKRLMKRLMNLLQKMFGINQSKQLIDSRTIIIKLLAVLLVLGALYFLIRIYMNKGRSWFFRKKSEDLAISIDDAEQLILHADFEQLIASHESNQDTRQCIRLYYLWLLRHLNETGQIEWTPDKTNADYVRELTSKDVKRRFEYLSYLFNCIWYGQFRVSDQEYQSARNAFVNYLKKEVMHG